MQVADLLICLQQALQQLLTLLAQATDEQYQLFYSIAALKNNADMTLNETKALQSAGETL
jgi:hypothetical protein